MPKTAWLAERGIRLPWPIAGLPRAMHVDNAKEFHSRALGRGCRQHGIHLDHRPVRTPRYGGHIERLMGTLMRRIHELPGTTFSNIREKGDADPAAAASLTMRELEMAFALDVLGGPLWHLPDVPGRTGWPVFCRSHPSAAGRVAGVDCTSRAFQFSGAKRPFSEAIAVGMARLGGLDPEFPVQNGTRQWVRGTWGRGYFYKSTRRP